MDENTQDTAPKADDKVTAPLAALVNSVLEKREAVLLKGIEDQIVRLSETPDRSTLEMITGDTPTRVEPNGSERIISRNQPSDPLYRNLLRTQPQFQGARDPDQDHWNAEWLRALAANDITNQKLARIKSNEAYARANLLEGVLDVSDPTALTDGSGSGLLPQSYTNVVEIAKGAAAVIAPLCANFEATGNTMRIPTVAAVTAVTASEGAAVTEANPAVASVMTILTKMGAQIVLSEELLADSAFNVMQITGARVGEGIGVLEDTQILTTNGTSPNITGALAGGAVTEATSGELGYYDLATLFFSVGKAYQPNGTWLAGTLVATFLTNLTDGNGNQVLQPRDMPMGPVTDNNMPGAIGSIFGRPVYHVPAVAGDLIFGDLRSYAWVRKGGIEAKTSTETGWAADTVAFKFTQRVDGQMTDPDGIKELQGLTSVV